jgi:uncharacterized peroxidase-related enzyme
MPRIAAAWLDELPETVAAALRAPSGELANLLHMLANSPAALQGYLGLAGALGQGSLSAQTKKRIALAVSEINACDYCLSGHTYAARRMQLSDTEITANRSGASNDLKADAALRLVAKITRARGHVSEEDVRVFLEAGYTEAQLVEIIALIALYTLGNYLNNTAGTEIDFPLIHARNF